ncbi:hypothetical protein LR48_Vigan02g027100 [Vigna angularis]|uniref:Putative plant transposon protein domain-containing protein n=1 Tax=Phaseolus angularis TaxID=3914 RepID=A0A0L9TUE2_PHAAN|nr:hypothetical protein LR48_Vigan02g027100 [Vigna angularis]
MYNWESVSQFSHSASQNSHCQETEIRIAHHYLCTVRITSVERQQLHEIRIAHTHLCAERINDSLFTFTNIYPNSHTSDINLERSYMVYGIMIGIDMDVGAYISQEMALIADNETCKLGFPALVTALCKASGVAGVSDITLKLQPPLNKKFFDRNCTNRGEFSAMNAPPPVPPPRRNVRAARPPIAPSVPSPDLFTRYMQQSLARQDDIRDWCTSMRQGQVSLQDSMYNLPLGIPDFPPDSLMTGAQFAAQIPWPEGRPESRWGSAYPGAPKLELDEQEDMMAGDGDEEEEEPDPRWTQQSYHSQESQWRSRSDGSW